MFPTLSFNSEINCAEKSVVSVYVKGVVSVYVIRQWADDVKMS